MARYVIIVKFKDKTVEFSLKEIAEAAGIQLIELIANELHEKTTRLGSLFLGFFGLRIEPYFHGESASVEVGVRICPS